MKRTQVLLCLFGISATLFINTEARSARSLEGEGIIGGDNAKEGQFPYQVSLQTYGSNICGGSILSDRFIITAAHCVVDEDGTFFTDSVKVIAGTSDLKETSKDRVAVDVVEVYVPVEYDPTDNSQTRIGDIAVLKLNKDLGIKDNSKLGKIEFPNKDENYIGVEATASGFGDNSIEVVTDPKTGEIEEKNGKSFEKLRYATAKVISLDDCQRLSIEKISEKHICAALVQRNKDNPEGLCSGDSGGPLVYNGAQIGIVSVSPLGCHEDSEPAVYTRVTEYIDFVNKVVEGKTDDSICSTTLTIED